MEKEAAERMASRASLLAAIVSVTALVAGIGSWLLYHKSLPPQIPLFYSQPWGEEQLADPKWLAIPIGLGLAIGAGLGVIAARMKGDPILSSIISTTAIIVQVVLVLGVIRIVWMIA